MNALESLTRFMEKLMANKKAEVALGIISIIAPLFFLKTVYDCWLGPPEIIIGFKTQRFVFLVLFLVDIVTVLTTLPSRKKGRVIQIVTTMWTFEMLLVVMAIFIK